MEESNGIGVVVQKTLHKIAMDYLKENEQSIKGMYLAANIYNNIISKYINEDVFHVFIYKSKNDIGAHKTTLHGTIAPCKYVCIPREKFNSDIKANYPLNTGIIRMAVFYEKESFLMMGYETKEDMIIHNDSSNKLFMECDYLDGCSVCGQSTKNKCSGCNTMYYCSKQCQKQGWKTGHKQCCKELQLCNIDIMTCMVAKHYRFNNTVTMLI